jgi:hypothetical protein
MAAVALSIVMSVTGVLVVTDPALASSASKATSKTFVLPGIEPDVDVTVTLQIEVFNGYAYASANISWDAALGDPAGRFHSFILDLRVEKYNGTSDVIKDRQSCDFTGLINSERDGWESCTGPFALKSGTGWSADGTISYDIVNDGLGTMKWELTGTPRL